MKIAESELIDRLAAWWRRLDEGVSGSSPIMDALHTGFGAETVDSNGAYELTGGSFSKIFDILNETLFEGLIVKKPTLIAGGKAEILRTVRRLNPSDFDPRHYARPFVGMFYSTYDIFRGGEAVDGKPGYVYDGSEEIVFSNETIFVNTDESSGFSFMAYVNCIAHEMIHCFDEYLGSTKRRVIIMNMFDCVIDPHTTDVFLKKQAEANGGGLNIVDRLFESGKIYRRMTMKEALEKCKRMEPRKCGSVYENGKWYVDMRDAPDLDTDTELHITVGPHTRALVQF